VQRTPTEANLRRALAQLKQIKQRIKHSTFDFREEFPDYRFTESLEEIVSATEQAVIATEAPQPQESAPPPGKTCDDVFDEFLAYCEMRVRTRDMAFSTLNSYHKILKRSWRRKLWNRPFRAVQYSDLVNIAIAQKWQTKRTYNNA
jgi:hypothetical protein